MSIRFCPFPACLLPPAFKWVISLPQIAACALGHFSSLFTLSNLSLSFTTHLVPHFVNKNYPQPNPPPYHHHHLYLLHLNCPKTSLCTTLAYIGPIMRLKYPHQPPFSSPKKTRNHFNLLSAFFAHNAERKSKHLDSLRASNFMYTDPGCQSGCKSALVRKIFKRNNNLFYSQTRHNKN